jgi:hypothetical protein
MLGRQSKTVINRYGAAYFNDMSAAFDDVLVRMFKKSIAPKDARKELVTRVQKLIDAFKSS